MAMRLEKRSFHLLCQAHKAKFSEPICLATIIPICGEAKAAAFDSCIYNFISTAYKDT